MPFTVEIREKALVRAARHCCVCHRYKGVKVEVHHIVPPAKGGTDTERNAIALCFDCHADAGHYNPNHPRGTKFSPIELRKHRTVWYRRVREHRITDASDPDMLYVRYLLCTGSGQVSDICDGVLSGIPVENPMLVENEIVSFQRDLLRAYGRSGRPPTVMGKEYRSKEEMQADHPSWTIEHDANEFNEFFHAYWTPSDRDVTAVSKSDPLSCILLNEGVSGRDLFLAGGHSIGPCGAAGPKFYYYTSYELRPLWAVYLAITNLSGRLLTLRSYTGHEQPSEGMSYRFIGERQQTKKFNNRDLPRAALRPNATALLAVGTLMGSLNRSTRDPLVFSSAEFPQPGSVHKLQHGNFANLSRIVNRIGPAIFPEGLNLTVEPHEELYQDIHRFDLRNIYVLDRYWRCGSCPHCFFKYNDGSMAYAGELLRAKPDEQQLVTLRIPVGASEILVAELEYEVTHLAGIYLDNAIVCSDVQLGLGEWITIAVRPGQYFQVCGGYTLSGDEPVPLGPWDKSRLISKFLELINPGRVTSKYGSCSRNSVRRRRNLHEDQKNSR